MQHLIITVAFVKVVKISPVLLRRLMIIEDISLMADSCHKMVS